MTHEPYTSTNSNFRKKSQHETDLKKYVVWGEQKLQRGNSKSAYFIYFFSVDSRAVYFIKLHKNTIHLGS